MQNQLSARRIRSVVQKTLSQIAQSSQKRESSSAARIALAISVIGLLLSLTNFYLARLSRRNLIVIAGPSIRTYYPSDGGFGIYCPVTFINQSDRQDTVVRTALIITRLESSRSFYLEWNLFETMSGGSYTAKEVAHALTITPRSADGKLIRFIWRGTNATKFDLEEGRYRLDVVVWRDVTEKPAIRSRHVLTISAADIETLESRKENEPGLIVSFPLDSEIPENTLLTPQDLRRLGL